MIYLYKNLLVLHRTLTLTTLSALGVSISVLSSFSKMPDNISLHSKSFVLPSTTVYGEAPLNPFHFMIESKPPRGPNSPYKC